MEPDEMIAIIQAVKDGKSLQYFSCTEQKWVNMPKCCKAKDLAFGFLKYRVKPEIPTDMYRPFTREEFRPHRDRWLIHKDGASLKVSVVYDDRLYVYGLTYSWTGFLHEFAFEDDGSPCGVMIQ